MSDVIHLVSSIVLAFIAGYFMRGGLSELRLRKEWSRGRAAGISEIAIHGKVIDFGTRRRA